MPPPDSALSWVGAGPDLPPPVAATALAVAGAGEGLPAPAIPSPNAAGMVKSRPMTTFRVPAKTEALCWVGSPPSAAASDEAAAASPGEYYTTDRCSSLALVVAAPLR